MQVSDQPFATQHSERGAEGFLFPLIRVLQPEGKGSVLDSQDISCLIVSSLLV